MRILRPRWLEEALEMKATHPEAMPIAGGTDVMVGVNFGHLRPEAMIDVSRLPELGVVQEAGDEVFAGAGVTFERIPRELAACTPLVQASRSVGSPQIRQRGTLGGNLGTASPAGDALVALAAYEAEVELRGAGGARRLAWHEFLLGPKRTGLRPDELIVGARWRRHAGTGSFSKVGPRNAMVIAVVALCLILDEERREVRVALGSAGPTVLRAPIAERFAADALERAGAWDEPRATLSEGVRAEFAQRVAEAARPIDDLRGLAAYRRHAIEVLARRALAWALEDRRGASLGAA